MMQRKVLGIVILYNPKWELVSALYTSISDQFDGIIFVDNSNVDNYERLKNEVDGIHKNYHYKALMQNRGIASAQNTGIEFAISQGYSHVMLLDQDSILPKDMISEMVKAERALLEKGELVGAVGPSFVDTKTGRTCGAVSFSPLSLKLKPADGQQFVETDYLIASGSLIRTAVFHTVGLMRDELFIDLVDIEWCERCKLYNFKCFAITDVLLMHSIGDEVKDVLGKNFVVHKDFRHYFIVRNSVFLLLYSKLSLSFKIYTMLRIPAFVILHSCTAKNKFSKFILMLKAIIDGVLKKMGKGYFNSL